ncbi:class I SAM-dependent methyltransferase [Ensifer sp. R-19]|uniref:class I SAM-dependent methyltransferase n=1 Tax=Ensifer sp. R-19 TaxID=3404055 RepID=UPI003CEA583E
MAFIQDQDQLVVARYTEVPTKIVEFVGDVAYKHILDVGCGSMMCDFRLVEWGAQTVTGYDIIPAQPNFFPNVVKQLTDNGFTPPDPTGRLFYQHYDGENFPAKDNSFDIVFSWGVFEHVANVPRVLEEMYRVLKPGCTAFVAVYPWWPCYQGSHLSDYIDEPFFHLRRSNEWVKEKLDEYSAKHPEQAELVSGHMWREYQSLNRISHEDFYRYAVKAGFEIGASDMISYRPDLRGAPEGYSFSELVTSTTRMALHKPQK